MDHLTAAEPFHHFLIVVFVSFVVGFLNAAAGGRIVPCHGQAEGGAVAELVLFLYEAFAKGPATDDGGSVPILQGAGQDFAGGGRPFVREDGQLACLEETITAAMIFYFWRACPYGIDDELVAVQEVVSDLDGFLEDAAAIATKVQYQLLQALLLELLYGTGEFRMRRLGELTDTYIAGGLVDHIRHVDGGQGNGAPGDGEVPGLAFSQDPDDHLAGAGSAQERPYLVVGDAIARYGAISHFQELIAYLQAGLIAGPAGQYADHIHRIAEDLELDAHPFEITLQVFVDLRHVYGGNEDGMGVQAGQHAVDGSVTQRVHGYRVYIFHIHEVHHFLDRGRLTCLEEAGSDDITPETKPDEHAQYHYDRE